MRTMGTLLMVVFTIGMVMVALPLQAQTEARKEAPLPEKIRAEDDASNLPAVTIRRQDHGDGVQEFREHGQWCFLHADGYQWRWEAG